MLIQLSLEVTRSARAGQFYCFEGKERIFIGRQADCAVVLPDSTVSRYHCMIQIEPPHVLLRDFGSLNGTFLNGVRILQRASGQSAAQQEQSQQNIYTLKNGDTLGLGSHCELLCSIVYIETCPHCGAQLGILDEKLVDLYTDPAIANAQNHRLCAACAALPTQMQPVLARCDDFDLETPELPAPEETAESSPLSPSHLLRRLQSESPVDGAEFSLFEQIEHLSRHLLSESPTDRAELSLFGQKPRVSRLLQPEAPLEDSSQIVCIECGTHFTPDVPNARICPHCRADFGKVRNAALRMFGADTNRKAVIPKGYNPICRIGFGAMGEVWKIQNEQSGRFFALKTIQPQFATDEYSRQVFLREAEIALLLKHKNIVKTYESGCVGGEFYILMEYCEGGCAEARMRARNGPLPLAEASCIILQVLDALAYAHTLDLTAQIQRGIFRGRQSTTGIIHRDIKPANFLLRDKSDHPAAVIADFGVSKAFDTAGLSRITKTGSVGGTVAFSSRQQAIQYKYVTPDADVWSAAASYYYLLTGAYAKDFYGRADEWTVAASKNAVPIRTRNATIPAALAEVLDAALVDNPAIGCGSALTLKQNIIAALPENVLWQVEGLA